jgi:hypothetical protein
MAYTINLTNGTILTTVADGTVFGNVSVTLIGKNYAGYGDFLNENFIHLLENFADSSSPNNPLTGQLWWDSAGNLKVYAGSGWRTISTITSSSDQPTSSVTGSSWWDTGNQQLNIYNGSSWVLIGPAFTSSTGQSGTIVGTITDSTAASHVAVNVYVENTLVGIISKDTEYTPQSVISGFANVKPGFNLSTAVASNKFVGTATNTDALGTVAAANYARTDVGTTFNSTVNVASSSGLTVGTSNNFTLSHSGTVSKLTNRIINANTEIIANVSGTLIPAITIDGTYGSTIVANLQTSGAFQTTGFIRTTQGDAATSTSTGALRVVGGIGLSGNVFTTANVYAGNAIISSNVTTSNISVSQKIRATGGVDSTSASTGDIIVSGGIGVGGKVYATGGFQSDTFVYANGVSIISTLTYSNANVASYLPTYTGTVGATTATLRGSSLTTGGAATAGEITGTWTLSSGSSLEATYADLAERFEADEEYDVGTVVQFGGEKEITAVKDDASTDVFGVISQSAAYLMNARAGSNSTHPAVALSGRVPVKVVGKVKKHDRLVSAGNGIARSARVDENVVMRTIGRALQDKTTNELGTVLTLVLINK